MPKKLIWFSKTCFVEILQFFWSLCFISSHIKLKRKFLIKYFSPHFITAIIKLTVEHQKYQTVCAKNVWHIYWCFVSDFLAAFLFACHKIIHSFTRFKVNGFYRQIIFLLFVHNCLNSKRAVRLIFRSRNVKIYFFCCEQHKQLRFSFAHYPSNNDELTKKCIIRKWHFMTVAQSLQNIL